MSGPDLTGMGDVRAAAQVDEVTVLEDGDFVTVWDVGEPFQFEEFSAATKKRLCIFSGHHPALERSIFLDDLLHLPSVCAQRLPGVNGSGTRKVVLEFLAVIGAACIDLRIGEQPLHCVSHDMLGGVTNDFSSLWIPAGDDWPARRPLGAAESEGRPIAPSTTPSQRSFGESGTDLAGRLPAPLRLFLAMGKGLPSGSLTVMPLLMSRADHGIAVL